MVTRQLEAPADLALPHAVRVPVVLARDGAELLALAEERAPDRTAFDEHPPVFYSAEISSTRLDSYFTRMMPSTLKNYADDATAGVAFQDSHQYAGMRLTLGRSVRGKYTQARADNPARTVVDFFTQPTLNDLMGEFVQRIRSGLAADVSVGYSGGTMECSICGKEMYSWWQYYSRDVEPCWHIPGVEYDLVDKAGKPTGERAVAEGHIEDGHLSEVSTVFDGATPNAGFIGLKARSAQQQGHLLPVDRQLLEGRYHINLGEGGRVFAVTRAAGTTREEAIMPKDETPVTYSQADLDGAVASARANALRGVRDALTVAGRTVAEADDPAEHIRAIAAETNRLRPLAADGEAWRASLVELTVTEGKRAFGAEFVEADERAELALLTVAGVQGRHKKYLATGDDIFKAGRATTDDAEKAKAEPTTITSRRDRKRRTDDRAFVV